MSIYYLYSSILITHQNTQVLHLCMCACLHEFAIEGTDIIFNHVYDVKL